VEEASEGAGIAGTARRKTFFAGRDGNDLNTLMARCKPRERAATGQVRNENQKSPINEQMFLFIYLFIYLFIH
jgi:hypothetical protein